MKSPDPIIAEIRAFRDALAQKCDYDIEKIAQTLREARPKGWKVVTPPPRRIVKKAS